MEDTGTAVVDAPSSPASSAPPSAPASPSPSASAPTTDRPSIGEALTAADRIVSEHQQKGKRNKITPVGEPTAPDATIDATAPTATAAPAGPIPLQVHQKALENARVKERQAVQQEYGAPPAVAREATQWFQRAAQDRPGFLRDVINEALTDPTLRPQVMSLLGQTLGSGNRPAAPAADQEPQPDFQDANGNQFYSAKAQQARETWLIQKAKAEILGAVQPDLDQIRTERETKAQEADQQQRLSAVKSHAAEGMKWPYAEQFKSELHDAIAAMPLTSGDPAEEAIVFQRAYWQVVGPKMSQLEQNRVLKDLKERANASSLNPASTGAPSGVPKNVRAKDGGTMGNALKWATAQTSGR